MQTGGLRSRILKDDDLLRNSVCWKFASGSLDKVYSTEYSIKKVRSGVRSDKDLHQPGFAISIR